jgi:glycosyltransferase involved in cell wall biosynthesis
VYATQLVRELQNRPEVDLKVFEGWDPGNRKAGEFGSQNVVARAARAFRGMAWSHGYFPYRLHREKFDLLHSPAFVVPFSCPCPAITTIHDVSFLLYPEHFERRWRTYLEYTMPSILKSTSAIICVSQHAKEELLKFYQVSPEKVHVIYNGVDSGRFSASAQLDKDWARSIGLTRDYILHVGLLSWRKNLPMLLRALSGLRDKGRLKNYQLVLAGPELSVLTGTREIHDSIRDQGLSEMVVLTGFVPEEKMPGLYAQARLLVMPSIYEGFGLPVVEAMASGTPVIASDTSSLPEVAGNAAILVSPTDEAAWGEAILRVLEDPATRDDLRRKGLVRARQFSWQRAAEETLALYQGVVVS